MSMNLGVKGKHHGGSERVSQHHIPRNTNRNHVIALVPAQESLFSALATPNSSLTPHTLCNYQNQREGKEEGGPSLFESFNNTSTNHHHPPAPKTLQESPLKWNMALQDIIDSCFEASNSNPTPEPNSSNMSHPKNTVHSDKSMDAGNDTTHPSSLPRLHRSPSLSGWRAVGSPSCNSTPSGNNGGSKVLTNSTKGNSTAPRNIANVTTALPSLMRNRSYSLLLPMAFHSTPTLLPDVSSSEESDDTADEDVAKDLQLPVSLRADIGIDSVHEMAQVFKRASICDLPIVDSSSSVDWKAGSPGGSQFQVHTLTPTNESTNSTPTTISPVSPGKNGRKNSLSLTGHPVPWTKQRSVSVLNHGRASSQAIPIASPMTSRRHSVVDALLLAGLSEQEDNVTAPPAMPSNSYTDNPSHVNRQHLYTHHDSPNPPIMRRPSSSSTVRHHQSEGVPLSYFMPSDPVFDDNIYADSMSSAATLHSLHNNHAYTMERTKSNTNAFDLKTFPGPIFTVEFKAGRTELCYSREPTLLNKDILKVGTYVIVEADRGEDLGRITGEMAMESLRLNESSTHSRSSTAPTTGTSSPPTTTTKTVAPGFIQTILGEGIPFDTSVGIGLGDLAALLASKEVIPKSIHRLATPTDLELLQAKAQEEALAMVRCQSRIRQRKLPMDVVDAEYQWDRNKLTFYFIADRRIDFRELVRDLFRIYKTRIWMCAVDRARLSAAASPSKGGGHIGGRTQFSDDYLAVIE